MDGKAFIEHAIGSADLIDKLPSATILAVCEDGAIYELSRMHVRPPVEAKRVSTKALIEWLQRFAT